MGSVILVIGLIHRALVRVDPYAEATNERFARAASAMRRARRTWIGTGLSMVLLGMFLRSTLG